MAHEEFSTEIEVLVHRVGELRMDHASLNFFVIAPEQRAKNFVERIRFHAPLAKHVRLAGGHVQFHASHARAVLAAVMLFFH